MIAINRFCLGVLWGSLALACIVYMQGCGNLVKDVHNLQSNQDEQDRQLQSMYNEFMRELAELQGYIGIVEIIEPCGDVVGTLDEVLLRLSDGSILASVSDSQGGHNTRFSLLSPGAYQVTDGTKCQFIVTSTGEVVW